MWKRLLLVKFHTFPIVPQNHKKVAQLLIYICAKNYMFYSTIVNFLFFKTSHNQLRTIHKPISIILLIPIIQIPNKIIIQLIKLRLNKLFIILRNITQNPLAKLIKIQAMLIILIRKLTKQSLLSIF